jgi:hypothetical protein
MLFLPMARSPARIPLAVGYSARSPSRREQMSKGAWLPDRAPFLCAAAHHHWKKVPQESGNLPGLSPQPLRRAARV